MRIALLLSIFSLAACRTSHLGACSSDAQCPAGSACDPASTVCVAKAGACFPACDVMHVCNTATLTCDVATTDVAITSPAAGSYASGTLQATATAHAPGGVVSLRFDLSSGGAVVATAQAQVSLSDPASFSAAIPLAAVADGAVSLAAVVTYAGGTAMSAPVALTVDQTPPLITLQTDGRTTLYGTGQTDTVVASISDATSGVKDSTVALVVNGHSIPGTAGAGGAYSFPAVIDNTIVAAGNSATVTFTIAATDNAGNTFTRSGDPREVIRADRDAPSITGVSFTPAGFTDGAGHLLIGGPPGGSIAVKADITDGAGVAAASVCLRVSGETSACPHPGAPGAGNSYTFQLPRPATAQDGSVATSFTLEADDALAALVPAAGKAEHQARLAGSVYFDSAGPSITVLADSTPYARTAVPIPVSALIADATGVPDGGVFLNGTLAPSFRDGGLFTFQLDARGAPAGVEGAYGFQVSAIDTISNSADAGGMRIIDDAPPDASVRVFKGADDGGAAGVMYPAAVPGTGWDGTQFIYNDTVHVKGTLTDVSGISDAGLHIDYVQVDGGVSAGGPQSLGCASGATTCTFDVQVLLNAPGNGTFNTFTRGHPMGDIVAPVDKLRVVIDSVDAAKSANAVAAAHAGTNGNDAQTTRATGLGALDGTPAIGAGDGGTARIYVAAEDGGVFAINPDGGEAWHYYTGDTLNVGPALVSPTAGPATDQVIVPGALTTSNIYSIGSGALLNPTGAPAVANANNSSAPLVLGGAVYFGNASRLEMHSISAQGVLGNASTAGATAVYQEVITDGASLFAWRSGITSGFTSRSPSLGFNWSVTVTPSGAGAVALDGSILVPLTGGPVNTFDPSPIPPTAGTGGNNSTLFNLGASGKAPLVGWDGTATHEHFYLPRATAGTYAYDLSGTLVWYAAPNGATYRAFTMDCAGRLFGASNAANGAALAGGNKSLVYALITDDRGLADTMWPSYRLDARNTGNTPSTYGILLKTSGTCSP